MDVIKIEKSLPIGIMKRTMEVRKPWRAEMVNWP